MIKNSTFYAVGLALSLIGCGADQQPVVSKEEPSAVLKEPSAVKKEPFAGEIKTHSVQVSSIDEIAAQKAYSPYVNQDFPKQVFGSRWCL